MKHVVRRVVRAGVPPSSPAFCGGLIEASHICFSEVEKPKVFPRVLRGPH